jgi:hypothetical protein
MLCNPTAFAARFALAASMIVLGLATTAKAATSCDQRILVDWSDNGRVDGVYPLPCYDEAIDALPGDIRDYTNAEEVIGRALTAALRTAPEVGGQAVDSTETDAADLPLVPLLGAGFAVVVVLAGGLALLVRRRAAS